MTEAHWKVTMEHRDMPQPYVYVSAATSSVEAYSAALHELSKRFSVNLLRLAKVTVEPA